MQSTNQSKILLFILQAQCTLYCDHKPLAPFFMTGMSSPVLDRWALELQQFNIKFQHSQGKRNVVDDAVSQLRTLGLYQENDNEDVPLTTGDVIAKHNRRSPHHRGNTENTITQCREAELRCTEEGAMMQLILQEQGKRNEIKARPQLPAR